jgi:hypothetical protein
MHMNDDARHGRLHAAVVHDVYGPSTHYSDDSGRTWSQRGKPPSFHHPSLTPRPASPPGSNRPLDRIQSPTGFLGENRQKFHVQIADLMHFRSLYSTKDDLPFKWVTFPTSRFSGLEMIIIGSSERLDGEAEYQWKAPAAPIQY